MASRPQDKQKLEPLSHDELAEMKSVFTLFDQNGDDTIAASDLGSVMRALGQYPTEDELNAILKEIDSASVGNGLIEYHKLVDVMSRRPYGFLGSMEELRGAFRPFDAGGCGQMNVDEFKRAMTTMGDKVSSEELDEILKHFQADGEGNVEYQGLLKMMME